MKMNKYQQRRKRAIFAGVIIGIAILSYVLAEPIKETFFGIPGYVVSPPAGSFLSLPWVKLEAANWESGKKPIIPTEISTLAGKKVYISGFVYPMSEHYDSSERIYLAPKPSSCYFCTPPAVNQVIEVNTAGAKKIKVLDNRSIEIFGELRIAKNADDTALYYLDNAIVMLKK